MSDDACTAPFGRRAVAVTARERHGAYVVLRCADAAGPRPQAGQFYMLTAAARWGGGASERPFLPRAFSVLRTAPATTARSSCSSCSRTSARAPSACASWRRATSCCVVGPLGVGFAAPAGGPLAAAGRRRGGDRAAGDPRRTSSARRRRCSGSATPPTLPGRCCCAPPSVATDDGSVGHHGLVTELLAERLDADDRRRGLRLRPAADARGGARAVRRHARSRRSWRSSPGWRAGSGPASGAWSRPATG